MIRYLHRNPLAKKKNRLIWWIMGRTTNVSSSKTVIFRTDSHGSLMILLLVWWWKHLTFTNDAESESSLIDRTKHKRIMDEVMLCIKQVFIRICLQFVYTFPRRRVKRPPNGSSDIMLLSGFFHSDIRKGTAAGTSSVQQSYQSFPICRGIWTQTHCVWQLKRWKRNAATHL